MLIFSFYQQITETLQLLPSPITAIQEHSKDSNHCIPENNFSILSYNPEKWNRRIREAIEIEQHKPV